MNLKSKLPFILKMSGIAITIFHVAILTLPTYMFWVALSSITLGFFLDFKWFKNDPTQGALEFILMARHMAENPNMTWSLEEAGETIKLLREENEQLKTRLLEEKAENVFLKAKLNGEW
jgi:hypothetical protein